MKGLITMIFVALFALSFQGCKEKVTVPIPQDIERAIEVKSVNNTVVIIEAIRFGGGVGVGMGVAEIQCKTPEQFLGFIPENSEIYTSVEKTDCYTLTKRYLAFMVHKPGVFVYERTIRYPYGDQRMGVIIHYTEREVTFRYSKF